MIPSEREKLIRPPSEGEQCTHTLAETTSRCPSELRHACNSVRTASRWGLTWRSYKGSIAFHVATLLL